MSAERPLTERQAAILAFLRSHQAEHGAPPSLREIGDHFGFKSTNGIVDHLRALVRKGAVTHRPGRSRGYAPAPSPEDSPPWDSCLVRFRITSTQALAEVARSRGAEGLPTAWKLSAVMRSGGGDFATFSVSGIPTAEAGHAVLTWLRELGAVSP